MKLKLPALVLIALSSMAMSRDDTASPDPVAALIDPAELARSLCTPGGKPLRDVFAPERYAMARPIFRHDDPGPVLYDNLGTYSYKVTTTEPMAQSFFDQGLRLAYGFNHVEAARAFRKAQRLDKTCALCYWGEALVLGPNINATMFPQDVPLANAAIKKAQKYAPSVSAKEQALIAALAKRYSKDKKADRKALDRAYAEAMAAVSRQYPDDLDIAVLSAEAIMDTQPWDYWEKDGKTPKGKAGDGLANLERVLAKNPQHPGAIHYYIHMVEASDKAGRAAPYAEKLAALMPGQGHIVHMPSHIWYRLGRYKESLEANKQAVLVDEAYFKTATPGPVYRAGYYPHNLHFVAVSAHIQGDAKTALEFADKLDKALPDELVSAAPFVHPVKAAPYFIKAELGDPEAFLASKAPDPNLVYVRGMWEYSRGIALVRLNRLSEAQGEAQTLAHTLKSSSFTDLTEAGIPAPELLGIAKDILQARIARAQGDTKVAISLLEDAAKAQAALPYMEPPFWYYPVQQTLGAVYLEAGRNRDAIKAFRTALIEAPNNAYALYGLSRAYQAANDKKAAKTANALFNKAWSGGKTKPALKDL